MPGLSPTRATRELPSAHKCHSRALWNHTIVGRMEPETTFAFGCLLRLTPTAVGGRRTPLTGGSGPDVRFKYRPNWVLPGMVAPDQTGAPVLGFDRTQVAPGESVRAVIVPPFPPMIPAWAEVKVGDDLPMYEGPNVCGHGRVLWRRTTVIPIPRHEEEAFRRWLIEGSESDEPTDA